MAKVKRPSKPTSPTKPTRPSAQPPYDYNAVCVGIYAGQPMRREPPRPSSWKVAM